MNGPWAPRSQPREASGRVTEKNEKLGRLSYQRSQVRTVSARRRPWRARREPHARPQTRGSRGDEPSAHHPPPFSRPSSAPLPRPRGLPAPVPFPAASPHLGTGPRWGPSFSLQPGFTSAPTSVHVTPCFRRVSSESSPWPQRLADPQGRPRLPSRQSPSPPAARGLPLNAPPTPQRPSHTLTRHPQAASAPRHSSPYRRAPPGATLPSAPPLGLRPAHRRPAPSVQDACTFCARLNSRRLALNFEVVDARFWVGIPEDWKARPEGGKDLPWKPRGDWVREGKKGKRVKNLRGNAMVPFFGNGWWSLLGPGLVSDFGYPSLTPRRASQWSRGISSILTLNQGGARSWPPFEGIRR